MAMVVVNRYARALADVVGRTGEFRKVQQELADFAAVYRDSAELREALKTPAVALPVKLKILDALLARLATSPTTSNFLRILLANYRLSLLDAILAAYQRIANERMGIVRVSISSAVELPPPSRQELQARFETLTRNQVEMEFRLEEGLVGGVLAQIGSTLYDGSVRGSLAQIRERLTAR